VLAARAADEKGAQDVVILEVGEVLVLPDEFVVSAGANERQVKAIVEEVERQIAEAGLGKPERVEGLQDRQWVLIDYGDVVVHVFRSDMRDYYELERLWGDVRQVEWASGDLVDA
jgi:ribosome-associated protein